MERAIVSGEDRRQPDVPGVRHGSAAGLSGAGRAIRELVHAAFGRAVGPARAGRTCLDPDRAEGRCQSLRADRPDPADRALGQERHPDRRGRARAAPAGGPFAHPVGRRGRADALPSDPDDVDRVHPVRGAAGARDRRGRQRAQIDRHHSVYRHDRLDVFGRAVRAVAVRGHSELRRVVAAPQEAEGRARGGGVTHSWRRRDGDKPANTGKIAPTRRQAPARTGKRMDRIWLKSYPPGVPSEIDPSHYDSLVALLEESFAKYRDRKAFICMDKSITYGELDEASRAFGASLQSVGLTFGARVAVMMPNVLQNPVAIAGILRAGMTVVNVNPLYTPPELEHQLNDSGAEAIIVLENFAATLEHCIKSTRVKHVILANMGDMLGFPKGAIVNLVVRKVKKMVPAYSLPQAVQFKAALAAGKGKPLNTRQASPEDVAFLQYTGGTTGV